MPRTDRRRGSGTAPLWAPADPVRAADVRKLAEQRRADRGPLLPILHDVLEHHGYIADDDIPVIAEVLNLSRADVHGVVTFYPDFRRTPPPAVRVALCRGEACQSVGAEELYAAASSAGSGDSDVEVGAVFCLGNCALGPSGVIDGQLRGRLTLAEVLGHVQGRQQ